MARDLKDWNYDRIQTAHAQISEATNDMMRCLHNGRVSAGVRNRMCQMLRNAADDLEQLSLSSEAPQ